MSRPAALASLLTLLLGFAAGCGKAAPEPQVHFPKIYAVEQQEIAAAALREGDELKAEQAAARAIEHDPDYPEPYGTLATVLARRGELRQARSLLDSCLMRRPDFADGFLFRGALSDELKESEAARADYLQASKAYEPLAAAHPEDTEMALKFAVTEYLRAGTPGLRLINALVSKYPDNHSIQFVKQRMDAQDRAFAFRWLTGLQKAGDPATK